MDRFKETVWLVMYWTGTGTNPNWLKRDGLVVGGGWWLVIVMVSINSRRACWDEKEVEKTWL